MIKSEIVNHIATRIHWLNEREINEACNYILEYVSDSLVKGHRVELRDFGTFSLHYHPSRRAINPKTGESVTTEGKYSIHYKPGKKLRQDIDEAKDTTPIEPEE
ncbi:MAG: integration host factor subunit beta [Legionellales bacterium]|nr:integration host factor subunit beta [Legionellales bacterium]